ncbi:hypothetical protein NDN08_007199 [Rhodosorus marinus]|uniref:Uncharacterized protein n=1 Tax=Rhodosorus marinus TaxID=101924 RepID=A0AAV8UFU5_9RHOD|nr:hypothetical protein NDN08_007199 [Rhodosorus marinus]
MLYRCGLLSTFRRSFPRRGLHDESQPPFIAEGSWGDQTPEGVNKDEGESAGQRRPKPSNWEGLNIFKEGKAPVEKPDDEYPDWIWALARPQRTRTELMKEAELAFRHGGEYPKTRESQRVEIVLRLLRAPIFDEVYSDKRAQTLPESLNTGEEEVKKRLTEAERSRLFKIAIKQRALRQQLTAGEPSKGNGEDETSVSPTEGSK